MMSSLIKNDVRLEHNHGTDPVYFMSYSSAYDMLSCSHADTENGQK